MTSSALRSLVVSLCAFLIATLGLAAPASASFGYLGQIGTAGPGQGQFFEPHAVAVGPDGNLYVADSGNGRVQVVAPSGAFVRAWGSAGSGHGQFEQLVGIGVGGSGSVYTAEAFNGSTGSGRVQKFDPAGNYLLSLGNSNQFNSMFGIAVDAADDVYVADGGEGNVSGRVQKFDSSGHLVTQWGSPGFGVGQFRGLSAITVDTAGNVYTVEARDGADPSASNNRVQKFDGEGHPKADFIDSEGNPT